jgi:hypothetical protein
VPDKIAQTEVFQVGYKREVLRERD